MRKDRGINGDAQRIEQLGWLLFLRILDAKEEELELMQRNYRARLPERLRWRSWASDDEGLTGDDLLKFVDTELMPSLKELASNGSGARSRVIKGAFEDANNY